MSVYVTDKEMDLLRELYDFYSTQMEGASLDSSGQEEYEHKASMFWAFYEKCKTARNARNGRSLVKRILRKC